MLQSDAKSKFSLDPTGLFLSKSFELVLPLLVVGVFLLGMFAGVSLDKLFLLFGVALVAIVGGSVVLWRPWWGVYALAFLIPFELYQKIPGLNVTSSKLIGTVLVVVFGVHFIGKGVRGLRRTPLDIPFCLFFPACFISLTQAVSLSEALQGLVSFLSYAIIMYLCVNLLVTKNRIMTSLWFLWLSLFLVSGFSFLQSRGYFSSFNAGMNLTTIGGELKMRPGGTSVNSALFVTFSVVGFGLTLGMLRMPCRMIVRGVLFFSLFIFLGSIYYSYTRSAMISVLAMCLCYGVLFAKRKIFFQVALVMVGLAVLAYLPGYVLDHFSKGLLSENKSTSSRVLQLMAGWELLSDSWVFGVGLKNNVYYLAGFFYRGQYLENTMHCTPIAILLDTGIFGFCGFVWILFSYCFACVSKFFKAESQLVKGVMAAGVIVFVGHMTHLVFHPTMYMSITGIVYGIFMAGWCSLTEDEIDTESF